MQVLKAIVLYLMICMTVGILVAGLQSPCTAKMGKVVIIIIFALAIIYVFVLPSEKKKY
ncbi:MAG: hypothetical protein QM737_22565 [Ferruginibacter sp.]